MICARFVNNFLRLFFVSLLFAAVVGYADNSAQLNVEIAKTPEQKAWGLMGRHSLPENSGMLFIYQPAQPMDFWMFNTYIDLSIAFIDGKKIIREIHMMKAYPEKMNPQHPIKKLSDPDPYYFWGPVKRFFRKKSVVTSEKYVYALEVNAGWFERNGVKVGDKIILDEKNRVLRIGREQ